MRRRSRPAMAAGLMAALLLPVADAGDDGPRAYWKTMEDTNIVSFQYLRYNVDANSEMYDPSLGIYPEAQTDLDIFMLSYTRQISLMGRSATLMGSIYGGDIKSEFTSDPFDPTPTPAFSQTNSGFGDPSVGVTVNLYGAPAITNFYEMANFEPRITLDANALLTVPIGEYDDDKFINLGQNRWWGRFALPTTLYFGTYAPLYRTSLEVTPSVWLFAKNDDFVGQQLENDPLYQIEAHLTRDFTRTFFGSIDFAWRKGFDSEIDGSKVGDELELKTLGFTLDFQLNANAGLRFSYHSNFIDDDDLDADMMRLQFYYGWNRLTENVKVLEH